MSNQETHKFLRRHKAGIRLEEVRQPDKSYKRPKGFDNIPQAIHEQRKRAPPVPVRSEEGKEGDSGVRGKNGCVRKGN